MKDHLGRITAEPVPFDAESYARQQRDHERMHYRNQAATQFMAKMLPDPDDYERRENWERELVIYAKYAVQAADALMKELEKPTS